MRKRFLNSIAVLTVLVLIMTGSLGVISTSTSAAESDYTNPTSVMDGNRVERVDIVTVAGRTSYMYVPSSNRVGNILGLMPSMMVFGDEKFTRSSAMETAKTKGFKEIAEKYGICILFVNPITSWDSAEDIAASSDLFKSIIDLYSSDPRVEYENGVGRATIDEQEQVVYPGSNHGLQVFGEGKGADYVALNYLQNMTYTARYATQEFPDVEAPPSGVALFNPTSVPANSNDGPVIPLAIVNGPEDSLAVAQSYSSSAYSTYKIVNEVTEGFDPKIVVSLYDEVVGKYFYSQGILNIAPKYVDKGIIEVNETISISGGVEIEVYKYIPDDLDLSVADSVPVMLWFHGFGGEAEYMLSSTEWPIIGKQNGFMVISVDQHPSFTATQIMEMLDVIIEDSPYIDETRIYASGFSMGGAKTWSVGLENADRIAAIVPTGLGTFGQVTVPEHVKDLILPTIYFAGGLSEMELGSSNFTQDAMTSLWSINNMVDDYSYDEAYSWGVPSVSTTTLNYRDYSQKLSDGTDQTLVIDAFESADGNIYTWMCVNLNKPHTITSNDYYLAWDYIKNYSRNPDGTLNINESTESPIANQLTSNMVGNTQERVDIVNVAGRTCYMYVPASNRVGNFLGLTPTVVVFGDEKYTQASALTAAQTQGFKEIAERDGLCILFANPIGSDWNSDEDETAAEDLFSAIFDIYSSRPDVNFADGKGIAYVDGQETTVYPGSLHGVQFFGSGDGADYVAANYMRNDLLYTGRYSLQEFANIPGSPSGVALFNPTTLNLSTTENLVIPMGIVNGPANSYDVATSYANNNTGISRLVFDASISDFDAKQVVTLYDDIVSKYYYSQGQLRNSAKYAQNGIIEVNDSKSITNGKNIEYYAYIPDDIELTENSVPLVMWFHGGGGEAEAMLSWTDWPLVGKENGFMVISVDQHAAYTSHEIVELLDLILEEYPFINEKKIYASGFSMGGGKTWNLAIKHWNRFAGIIPTAAGTMVEGEDVYADYLQENVIMPTFYIAGGASFLPELPNESPNNVNEILSLLWAMNGIEGEFSYNNALGTWGTKPNSELFTNYVDTSDMLAANSNRLQTIVTSDFESKDGNVFTWLSVNVNKSHTLTNNDMHIAWEYIKQFSRNSDGTIAINGINVLPLSSGAVAVDKELLRTEITDAEKLNEAEYTVESWKNLSEALVSAKVVLNNEKATQEEVDNAIIKLQTAMDALVKIPGASNPPQEGASEEGVTAPPQKGTSEEGVTAPPKTGVNSPVLPTIISGLLSVAVLGATILLKRRNRIN